MANKQISQLTEATSVNVSDLFVLEQNGASKKLTGQTLINDLATALDGHGGIVSIEQTASVGLVDTYTITLADGTTATFTVTNGSDGTDGTNGANGTDGVTFTPSVSGAGVISWTNDGGLPNPPSVNIKGPTGATGAATYTYIKWSDEQPTADADMGDIPSDWLGIYVGSSSTTPTHYTDYVWYEIKGETGATGTDGESIGSVVWLSNSSGSPQGTAGTTDTYQVKLSDNTVVGTFEVTNGLNGTGLVDSVNGVSPVNGEVTLTASDVGAAQAPLHITATISTSPATISDASITADMRVIEIQFGTPSAVKKDVAWTTSDGSIVLGDASTFSSTTTVDIILAETT